MGLNVYSLISTVLLMIMNIFFLICGISICITAVWFIIDSNAVYNTIDNGPRFFLIFLREKMSGSVGVFMLFLGITTAVISSGALYGIVFRNPQAVKLYAVTMMLVISVHALTVIILLWVYMGESGQKRMIDSIKRNYMSWNHPNFITIVYDLIFIIAECCGISGVRDFNLQNLGHNNNDTIIPWSCCTMENKWKLQQVVEDCPIAGSENGLRPCFPVLSSGNLGEKVLWFFGFAAVPFVGLFLSVISLWKKGQQNRQRYWLFGQNIDRPSQEICSTTYVDEVEPYFKMTDEKLENTPKKDTLKSLSSKFVNQLTPTEKSIAIVHSDIVISHCSYNAKSKGCNEPVDLDKLGVQKGLNNIAIENKRHYNDLMIKDDNSRCSHSEKSRGIDIQINHKNKRQRFWDFFRKKIKKREIKNICICGSSETLNVVKKNKNIFYKAFVSTVKFEERKNCSCGKDCRTCLDKEQIKHHSEPNFSTLIEQDQINCLEGGKQICISVIEKESLDSQEVLKKQRAVLPVKIEEESCYEERKQLEKDFFIFNQKSSISNSGKEFNRKKQGNEAKEEKFGLKGREAERKNNSQTADITDLEDPKLKNDSSNTFESCTCSRGQSRSPSPTRKSDSKGRNKETVSQDSTKYSASQVEKIPTKAPKENISPEESMICICPKNSFSEVQKKPTSNKKSSREHSITTSEVEKKPKKTSNKNVSPEKTNSKKKSSPEESSTKKDFEDTKPKNNSPNRSESCTCSKNSAKAKQSQSRSPSPTQKSALKGQNEKALRKDSSKYSASQVEKRPTKGPKKNVSPEESMICICPKNSFSEVQKKQTSSEKSITKTDPKDPTLKKESPDRSKSCTCSKNSEKAKQSQSRSPSPTRKSVSKGQNKEHLRKDSSRYSASQVERKPTTVPKKNAVPEESIICICPKKSFSVVQKKQTLNKNSSREHSITASKVEKKPHKSLKNNVSPEKSLTCICSKNSACKIKEKTVDKKNMSPKREISTDRSKKSSFCICQKSSDQDEKSKSDIESIKTEEDFMNNEKGVQVSNMSENKNPIKSFFSRFCRKKPKEKNKSMDDIRICLCSKKRYTIIDKPLTRAETCDSFQSYPEYPNKLVGPDVKDQNDGERVNLKGGPSYTIYPRETEPSTSKESFKDESDVLIIEKDVPEIDLTTSKSISVPETETKSVNTFPQGQSKMVSTDDLIDICNCGKKLSEKHKQSNEQKEIEHTEYSSYIKNSNESKHLIAEFEKDTFNFKIEENLTENIVSKSSKIKVKDETLTLLRKPMRIESLNGTDTCLLTKECENCECNYSTEESFIEINVENNYRINDDILRTKNISCGSCDVIYSGSEYSDLETNDEEIVFSLRKLFSYSTVELKSGIFNDLSPTFNQSASKYEGTMIDLTDKRVYSKQSTIYSIDKETATKQEDHFDKSISSMDVHSTELSNLESLSSNFQRSKNIFDTRCSDCGLILENVL